MSNTLIIKPSQFPGPVATVMEYLDEDHAKLPFLRSAVDEAFTRGNDPRPIAAIVTSSYDWNGALNPLHLDIRSTEAIFDRTHRVVNVMHRGGEIGSCNKALIEAFPSANIEYIVYNAHGPGLRFDEKEVYRDPKKEEFSGLSPDTRIFLNACEAGHKGGIGEKIHLASGLSVSAANDINLGGYIFIGPDGKYELLVNCQTKAPEKFTHIFPEDPIRSHFVRTTPLSELISNIEAHNNQIPAPLQAYAVGLSHSYGGLEWIGNMKAASNAGVAKAQYEYGLFWESRKFSLLVDFVYAWQLNACINQYSMAAKQGDERALLRLVELCIEGELADDEEIKVLLGPLLLDAALNKDSRENNAAKSYLAYFIAMGWYTHPSLDPKSMLFEAVRSGDPSAAYVMGIINLEGNDLLKIPKKENAALYFFNKVAKFVENSSFSEFYWGRFSRARYALGLLNEGQDDKKALEYYSDVLSSQGPHRKLQLLAETRKKQITGLAGK